MKVIMFKAPGCGPCKMMAPYLERAKELYPNVAFETVDMSTDTTGIAAKYRIRSAPSLVALGDDGWVLNMTVGGRTEKQFQEWLEAYL